ncbi:MAG: sodium:solute symporter family protein [Pirellulaceae bacterium]|jgi:Na+/proline symporter|nr:sodium:solute symporter family protein [Pirellulaceae bacterium]MDP7016259.1 sodium:solute symporter family protein [Pirellulaceae bacterium]
MNAFSVADWIALAAYLLGVTALGVWASRRVRDMSEFIMPRRFGKWMMLMHGFGTATHSDQAVTVASKCYTSGLAGIWYQWMWLFATPFFWLIAPMMRRFRALTTADVFAARYGPSVAVLFCVFGLAKFVVTIGNMLKGSGAIVEACTKSAISAELAIVVMTALFLVYGLAGGLRAAIITDFVQGVLTLLFSFLLLPFALQAVGGIAGMRESFSQLAPGRDMLSLVTPGDIGAFYIGMIAFNALLSVAVQPHNMGTCAAGRTEIEGAVGFMGGTFLKRICTVAWCLTGLAAFAYYRGNVEDPDHVYGAMAADFLPRIMPGLLGMFLAGLLATVMGSCDSFMIAAAGLVTENLYRPLAPNRSPQHYLWIARGAGLIVVVAAIVYSFWLSGVIQGLELLWKLNAVMAPAFWLGVFWRRATTPGAWAATIATAATWWITSLPGAAAAVAAWPATESWGVVVKRGDVLIVSVPWQMLAYLTAGFLAGVVVSLLTSRQRTEQLDRFYELLRTPVQLDEVVERPCTLPAGVTPPPPRSFFPNTDFEIPIPSARATAGFTVGWLLVLAIIGGVWWLVS